MELEKIILHEKTQKDKDQILSVIRGSYSKCSNVCTYRGVTIESWKVKRDPCWGDGGGRRTAGFDISDLEMGNGTFN